SWDEREISLGPETVSTLQAFARGHRLTLNTLLLGAWAVLLSRYSGEQDVLFGATVSGRPPELQGVEEMVGLFINTLPVRVHVGEDELVVPWLRGLQARLAEQRNYEHSPFVDVQGWSDVPRGTSLFDSILVFENYPMGGSFTRRSALTIDDVHLAEKTNYPLTITAMPGIGLALSISYDAGRFEPAAID